MPPTGSVRLQLAPGSITTNADWREGDEFVSAFGAPTVAPGWKVDRWRVEQGLPGNHVRVLLQTRDGYLWIGTTSGLVRFDGRRFVIFDQRNEPEMLATGDDIRSLAEDNSGTLWIGTRHGLLQRREGIFVPLSENFGELTKAHITALSCYQSSDVWIGTENGVWHCTGNDAAILPSPRHLVFDLRATPETIYCIDTDTVWAWHRSSAPIDEIHSPLNDFSRRLWLDGSMEPLFDQVVLTNQGKGPIFRMTLDFHGVPLFATQNAVLRWNRGTGGLEEAVSGISNPDEPFYNYRPVRLEEGSGAQLWLSGGREAVLGTANNSRLVKFVSPDGPITDVECLLRDRQGNLWVGTSSAGLIRIGRNDLATLNLVEPFGFEDLTSVTEAMDGSIWCGTKTGVLQWGKDSLRIFQYPGAVLYETAVDSVARLVSGQVWASFGQEAILELDGHVNRASSLPAFLPKNRLPSPGGKAEVIYQTRNGILWIGTKYGLYRRVNDADADLFTLRNGLGVTDVRALLEDREGTLWVGTYGGGISRMKDQTAPVSNTNVFETFTTRDGLSHNRAWALYEDSSGIIWIGTENGLTRMEGGRFFAFSTAQGLFDSEINHLIEDDFGRFWISCNRGIFRVARSALNAVASGQASRVSCTCYSAADGMLDAETNGEHQPAGCKAGDGRLFFPTRHGLVIIDPKGIRDKPAPAVLIEQVLADGVVIFGDRAVARAETKIGPEQRSSVRSESAANSAGSIHAATVLPAGRSRTLEIHYTATSLFPSRGLSFEYQLKGFDSAWRTGNADRVASYNNLRPGSYDFRVRAVNHGGVPNESQAQFRFVLKPQFWQTWPFYILCGAAVVALGSSIQAYRLRVQRHIFRLQQTHALELERARIARDMHDQLGAKLSLIALGAGQSNSSQNQVRQTVRELNDLIWSIHPKNDSISGLADFLSNFAREYLDAAGLALDLDFQLGSTDLSLPGTTRTQIAAAFKETLRNVVQHAKATGVGVKLEVRNNSLLIEIADDGCGFDVSRPLGHVGGLCNIRTRLADLEGDCQIESKPGHGASVRFSVPLYQKTHVQIA
jgi:ligand-binding sensor domain-containing protein/signal transduction histidine kinase